MKKLLFTLVILFSQSIFAGEYLLLNITNDEDKELTKFILLTDSNNEGIEAFDKRTFSSSGRLISKQRVRVNQIAASSGIVLDRRLNKDIVVLRSENFASHNGGDLEVDTLYNGITGSRKHYDLDLQRHGASWKIERYGKVITSLHLESHVIFWKTVGIKNIITK
jgi:hypothetical protein